MFAAFLNCLRIPELRSRIFYTLGLVVVARIGAHIPIPGLNTNALEAFFTATQQSAGANLFGMFNMFVGGALQNGAVFALGIMPYISASIILQLMTAVVPTLSRLAQEGDIGRQKITQYTRYLTIIVGVIQSILIAGALCYSPASVLQGYDLNKFGSLILINPTAFTVFAVILLTTGTMILMWLGEQITQRGIGNGISILITVGIVDRLPHAFVQAWQLFNQPIGVEGGQSFGAMQALFLLGLFFAVVAAIIYITQGQRKIPVQYAKRVVGRKIYEGRSSFLPLKVNYTGVMPVIFASAILMFPQQIFSYLFIWTGVGFFDKLSRMFMHGEMWFYVAYGLLIFGFSFFWVSIMFKPLQIADDLKKYGGYIPGVRPGESTARFLDFVMTRLTLAGAIFLTVVAIIPDMMSIAFGIPYSISAFFGGTGTLIYVGVILDTMRQIETFLLQRHYDGFLRKGRASKTSVSPSGAAAIDATELRNLKSMWWPLGVILVVGFIAGLLRLL